MRLLMPLLLTFGLLGCSSSEQKQEPNNSSNGKPSGQDAVKEEMQKLQGSWRVVSGVAKGEAIPKEGLSNVKIIFEGNKWIQTRSDERAEKRYRLGPTLSPKTIDLVETVTEIPKQGPQRTREDIQPGIYELTGDRLRICLSVDRKERPTDFNADKQPAWALIVLKRERP